MLALLGFSSVVSIVVIMEKRHLANSCGCGVLICFSLLGLPCPGLLLSFMIGILGGQAKRIMVWIRMVVFFDSASAWRLRQLNRLLNTKRRRKEEKKEERCFRTHVGSQQKVLVGILGGMVDARSYDRPAGLVAGCSLGCSLQTRETRLHFFWRGSKWVYTRLALGIPKYREYEVHIFLSTD